MYHTKYHDWYELNDALTETSSQSDKDAVAQAKTDYEQQEGVLPEGTDLEIIKTEVKDSEDFQKFKMSKIDGKNLTPKCSTDGGNGGSADFVQCTPTTGIEAITKDYLNAEEVYDQVKAKEDGFANVVKSAQGKIDAHNFSTMATCDAAKGITWTVYDDADCKGEKSVDFKAAWGVCTQSPDGKSFVKVTGAAALQAAAVALVAFAGSQF